MEDSTSEFFKFVDQIKSGNIEEAILSFKLQYLEMSDETGKRPIHYACQYNHIELVKLLLEHKCNIDANDNNRKSSIHYACENGNIELTKLLLDHGCIADIDNNFGKRPIHYACENNNIELVKLLLVHQCNIDADNDIGKRPMHYACKNNNIELVKLLLNYKCVIDAPDDCKKKPIHYACEYGNKEIVSLLLANKCQINESDFQGNRPIHYACKSVNIDLVKLLLEHKCNIKESIKELLKIAKRKKSQKIVDLLNAAKSNQSMCSIAIAMSLECESHCSHKSCFISFSTTQIKKNSRRIGSGSFGTIHRFTQCNRDFAMKIVSIKSIEANENETKKIEADINYYRHVLKHENIVEYYGAVVEHEEMIIFMEYVNGNSLHEQIRDHGALPHYKIAIYSKQILFGIAFLHQKKIIHRDVKPANILLDSGGKLLKLCDLGISRSLRTISTFSTQNATTGCGTPNYMAPEVINGESYRYAADIWSIGATVVEMLTGKCPYYLMDPTAVIYKIGLSRKIEFTAAQPMSDNLNSFVDQMLQSDPLKRASAMDLLKCNFLYC